jgi:hypothetical protein
MVFATNKTDRHNIAERLLKVALNTIVITPPFFVRLNLCIFVGFSLDVWFCVFVGFTLDTWLSDNFPSIGGRPLPDYAIALLLEKLGISPYLPSTLCLNTDLYMTATGGEWINGK